MRFYTKNYRTKTGYHEVDENSGVPIIRESDNWEDIPLGAVPILEEGYPEMPDYMNGRTYFLWLRNDFKTSETGPVIVNPYPKYQNVTVQTGGSKSYMWGI